ncbi:MAG TPA: ABC transporter ATP-binding protein [Alphaproteobacteria bacterium]|nr:ABC transporter ATP-binding protein [Alphaproteobacteria bacterium]
MGIGARIDIEGLSKAYGQEIAVDQVSLSVNAGEFVTLLGASGSGKTTTLMSIAGFVAPDAGKIQIGGRDIARLPPEKRGLGVVFQSYALFPNYSVYENIAFPLRLRKTSGPDMDRRIKEVLSLVDLSGYEKRRIDQLSGGQQQRVALARAIVFSPPVLLMDEPLGALDRNLRDQLQTEIKRIQRDLGVTVLYVTHDQEEALALSDRIAIMDKGRIAQLGTPDEVYERPSSPFVARFLGESNFIPVKLISVNGRAARVRAVADGGLCFTGLLAETAGSAQDLVAMIRPEAFRSGAQGEAENCIKGTVRLREFLGPTVRLTVACSVAELTVRLPRLERDRTMDRGSPIDLLWRSSDTLLFPRA